MNVSWHDKISPVDEYVYLDYTAQVFEHGILPRGTETGDVARGYISCLGVAGYGEFNPTACGTGDYSDDNAYPYAGLSSADIYTPIYFVVSAATANVLMSTTNIDFLSAARLSGVIWLAGAAALLYFSLLRLRISALAAVVAPLLLISSVPAWWSTTFISTDATAIFSGALMLFFLVHYLQRGRGAWLLVLASGLVTLLKFQNIMAVAVAAVVIALSARFTEIEESSLRMPVGALRKRFLVALSMIFTALGAQIAWFLIHEKMAISEPAEQGVSDPLTVSALLAETTKLISGMAWGASAADGMHPLNIVVASITTWLLIGGAVAASIASKRVAFLNSLGFAWLGVAMLAAPILGILIFIASGFYFHLPARYGLSLLPIGLAISTLALGRAPVWRFLLPSFAVFSVAVGLLPTMHQ